MRLLAQLSMFSIFLFVSAEQKPFAIVIPSYNNAQWYEKNLESIFQQQYDNYRVIYIDDCSSDGTYELVKHYVIKCGYQDHVTLIKNEQRCGALANHYRAAHLCADYEIIVNLDGDDWFTHNNVLARINQEYQNTNVWMTYGQYSMDPPDKPGRSKPMPPAVVKYNGYREYEWITSAVRTFYAGLFKRIQLKDLLYEGQFYETACDLAFMFPMLEMSAGRIAFIPDILYIYNCHTPENDFKKRWLLQLHLDHVIRAQRKYSPLYCVPYAPKQELKEQKARLLIFSDNNSHGLDALLDSVARYLQGVADIVVLYRTNQGALYESIKQRWADVQCIPVIDLKAQMMELVSDPAYSHIIFAKDTMSVIGPIDAVASIQVMEQTQAHGVYYGLGQDVAQQPYLQKEQQIPSLIAIDSGFVAWQFSVAEYAWRKPYATAALYRAIDVMRVIAPLRFRSISELEAIWNGGMFNLNQVGICYELSKVKEE